MGVKIALLAQSRQRAAVTHILVIEDDRAIRDLLRDVLSDEGYELIFVDGLEHATADATPNLVITDLAGTHGYDRRLARAFEVGSSSASGDADHRLHGARPGGGGNRSHRRGGGAAQPFPIEVLVETVARLAAE